jgi:hypothetical protein
MSEFLPNDEPGLADWFVNYAQKMESHGAEHGFTEAEIGQVKDDATIVENIVAGGQAIAAYRSEYSKFKQILLNGGKNAVTPDYPGMTLPTAPHSAAMLAGIKKRTKSLVRRLRESSKFNEAVAADFRVLPLRSNRVGVVDEAKPVLKPQMITNSRIAVGFRKNGFVGIELEMQRGDDASRSTGFSPRPPRTARRPLPPAHRKCAATAPAI